MRFSISHVLSIKIVIKEIKIDNAIQITSMITTFVT